MSQHIFTVDKDKSLAILQSIFDHLKTKNQFCLNENMNGSRLCDVDDEEDDGEVIDFKHKLAIVQLYGNFDEKVHIEQQQELFFASVNAVTEQTGGRFKKLPPLEQYDTAICIRSDQVEIMEGGGEIIDNDIINLTAYVHESSFECDVSYFEDIKYSDVYKCWIYFATSNGFDDSSGEGMVVILDFSSYF